MATIKSKIVRYVNDSLYYLTFQSIYMSITFMHIIVCLFMSPIFPKIEFFFQFTWDHKTDFQHYNWLFFQMPLIGQFVGHMFIVYSLPPSLSYQRPTSFPWGVHEVPGPGFTPISRDGADSVS